MNPELKQFLDIYLQENTHTNAISAFPLPCGIGKSQYIAYAISDALNNDSGLIVITDAINRLNHYTSSPDEQLAQYIERNLNRISILSSENIATEVKTLYQKPIILMSTQRFFNLSRDEIIEYTTGHSQKRNKIIFDEKPYLLESRRITVKTLNDIDSALKQALDNEVNQDEKDWIITQWQSFNKRLQQELKTNEKLNDGYKREHYFNCDGLTISEDDNRFNELIMKYKDKLNKYSSDVLKDIHAVNRLLAEGIITSQKIKGKVSSHEYSNFFTVIINHSDKLLNIGAKVFVLDGTSNVSPEYKLKCVDLVDCSRLIGI